MVLTLLVLISHIVLNQLWLLPSKMVPGPTCNYALVIRSLAPQLGDVAHVYHLPASTGTTAAAAGGKDVTA